MACITFAVSHSPATNAHARATKPMSKGRHRAKLWQPDSRRISFKIAGLINMIAYHRYRKKTR